MPGSFFPALNICFAGEPWVIILAALGSTRVASTQEAIDFSAADQCYLCNILTARHATFYKPKSIAAAWPAAITAATQRNT